MKGILLTLLTVLAVSTYARVPGSRITVMGVDECPKEQETNWEIEWLMRHEDCNKFYKCTFGKPVEFRCFGDLFFNLETWQCDWQHNVDCEDRIVPDSVEDQSPDTTTTTTTTEPTTTTTEPTTTTTEPTTTTTEATTTTTTTTTTTPAPTTTTTTTTTPAPTTTTTTTTTAAPTTTTTAAPTTTAATTTTTTAAPTTTSAPTTTTSAPVTDGEIEFQENGCPVDPHIHWLLPHETDCNLFYYCVWGQKVLRNCPGDLHFNTVLQVCDHQVDAGCTLSSKSQESFLDWLQNLL